MKKRTKVKTPSNMVTMSGVAMTRITYNQMYARIDHVAVM